MKTKIFTIAIIATLLSVSAAYGADIKKLPRNNTITVIDKLDDVGYYSSVTFGTDGLPVISYHDMTNGTLKVAKCENSTCSKHTITTVDNSSVVGNYTSIAIGRDGFPVISYYDCTNADLKVVKCGNASCSSGNTITTVDNTGNEIVGFYTSITIGRDGLPVISYLDNTNIDLKVAKCGNPSCSDGNIITVVDSDGEVGNYTSITTGTDGLPIIAYYDLNNAYLKVAKCGNAACSEGNTITTVDNIYDVGRYTSIIIGTDGLPVISYVDGTNAALKVAKCGNASCSEGNTVTTVDSTGMVKFTSSYIGADGLPVIAYHCRYYGYLKFAKCGNESCTTGNTVTIVDSDGFVGANPHIAIGSDGLPVISYADETNMDLKFLKCANQFCIDGWSGR